MITPARLAETEYTFLADPRYVTETEFGAWICNPNHPDRSDANNLVRAHCAPDDLDRFFDHFDALYERVALTWHKATWHDALPHLEEAFQERGRLDREWMMVHERPSRRPVNPDVEIRIVTDENRSDLERLKTVDGKLGAGYLLHRDQDERMGGEWLIGYLGGRPAGSTGWYVVDGIARFRNVTTMQWARGNGVAGTLIQHVQNHPTVCAQEALVIFCGEDGGPVPLYEQLGFVKRHPLFAGIISPDS